jgi:type II secretory pathway component GspD/PulD (secretin)
MPSADLLSLARIGSGRRRRRMAIAAVVGLALAAYLVGDRWVAPTEPEPTRTEEETRDALTKDTSDPEPMGIRTRPLAEWLAELAAEAGKGLVVAPELTGEVSAVLPSTVLWPAKLEALSRVGGFAFRADADLVEAWLPAPPSAPAVTVPAVDPASPMPLAMAEAVKAPGSSAVVRLTNARATEVVQVLDKALREADVQLAADAASNALVAHGSKRSLSEIERLTADLDVPRRCFVLEAQIIELKRSTKDERGVRWILESGDVTGLVDFPAADRLGEQAGIIIATSGSHTLRARISALEASGRVRVVSRPRVIVLEGRPASIESVRILRVRLPASDTVLADAGEVTVDSGQAVQEIPVGVSLLVEPSMQGQGKVVLRIRAKSSTLGPPLPPDNIPEELSRVVDTDVIVGDGETAVLGGLLRDSHTRSGSGVPVLRTIPVVGVLFGKKADEREGEELLVLITPRLLS